MTLTVAVQMDPIQRIRIAGDSTFGLMLEAQRRGHRLLYYTPEQLSLRGDQVLARVQDIEVRDVEGDHFTLGAPERIDLSTVDAVLMRQDPPFDLAYITATHFLERIHPKTLVVNDPTHVRNAPEKIFVTHFPHLMPPTLISRDKAEIEEFRREHGDVVMKPLYGHGGASVFKVGREDPNFGSLYDLFATTFKEPWVVQQFLPQVSEGDKRIILVDGKAAGAVNRVPAANDIRSNMVRGGAARPTDLTPREREICETIGPELARRGLIFVGIDVIAGNLTEINVTSPTGIRAIKRLGGPDLAAAIWDAIEEKRSQTPSSSGGARSA
jgi:glutathione synthase